MKVYVKKKDKDSLAPKIFIIFLFIFISFIIYYPIFTSKGKLIDKILNSAFPLTVALLFSILDIIFIYFLLKKPKTYNAKLINKKVQKYNGKQITYMTFHSLSKSDDDYYEFKCYTEGSNNLEEDKYYQLKVKEFNMEAKYVEETDNKKTDKLPKRKLSFPILIVALLYSIIFVISITGILIYHKYYLEKTVGIIFSIFAFYDCYKMYNKDNK